MRSSGRNGETATRVSLSSKRSLHGKERRRRPRRSNDELCLCFPWLSDVEPILRPQLESIVGFENAWNFVCSTSEFINYTVVKIVQSWLARWGNKHQSPACNGVSPREAPYTPKVYQQPYIYGSLSSFSRQDQRVDRYNEAQWRMFSSVLPGKPGSNSCTNRKLVIGRSDCVQCICMCVLQPFFYPVTHSRHLTEAYFSNMRWLLFVGFPAKRVV